MAESPKKVRIPIPEKKEQAYLLKHKDPKKKRKQFNQRIRNVRSMADLEFLEEEEVES